MVCHQEQMAMADVRTQLLQAYNWIKEGKRSEAEVLLIRVLGSDEKNADAWWLLANALTEPAEQAEALDQLLALRPDDEKAKKMLAKLRLAPPPAAPPPPPPPRQAAPPPARAATPPPARPAPKAQDPFETVDDDDDPFGDVKSSDADPFAEVVDSRRKPAADVFDDEDPFAVADAVNARKRGKAAPSPQASRWERETKREAPNRTLMIVGGIAIVLLLCGGICAFTVIQLQRGVEQAVTTVMNDPTVQAALADPTFQAALASGSSGFASDRVPTGTSSRGPLMPNQTGSAVVDTFVDDTWIFNADAGAAYTVEVTATDGDLDPQLSVYGADGQLVGANDDIEFMENRNSRLQFTASQNGIYTIVVSAFGEGGNYEVVVRR
jgi:hypothetical protein